MKIIDQFINFVIRPPRAEYNPDQYLWESDFSLAGRKFKRQDLELVNGRGHTLKCSHYFPASFLEDSPPLPCVVYCHGNSGCRADANEAAVILLPSNITLFTLDFSGSGLSDGDYVSLGWHEKDDLKTVVNFLRSNKQVSCIGLWGRSMGAVTSILYGAEDPSIAGMVLDSAFSNLFDLMMELADVYKIRVPKFTVRMAIQYMRRIIQKKAKFDIMQLNAAEFAPKTFMPALFGHASDDMFIQPHHSDLIYKSYAGDKNIIKFDGNHNSPRPQFYYDSVSIFFYNVLHPPQVSSPVASSLEKYYDLEDLKFGSGMDESLLYEIISGLNAVSTDASSSSSVPPDMPKGPNTTSMIQLLSEVGVAIKDDDLLLEQENMIDQITGNDEEQSQFEDKGNYQSEDCCSGSSSNRESWGRCSSLGASDEGPSSTNQTQTSKHQIMLRALATPLRKIQGKSNNQKKEKKKPLVTAKKPKSDRFEKFGAFGHRLRLCITRRVSRKRHTSS